MLLATENYGLARATNLVVDGIMTPRLYKTLGTTTRTCYPTAHTTQPTATRLPTLPRFYLDRHPCTLRLTPTTLVLPDSTMTPIMPHVTLTSARILAVVTLLLLTMLPPLLHSKG